MGFGRSDASYGDLVQEGAAKGSIGGPWGAAGGAILHPLRMAIMGGGGGGGLDRSALAEERYGGVDAGNFDVPGYRGMFDNYSDAANRYGQQGSSFRGGQEELGGILRQEAMGRGVGQQLVRQQARDMADRASAQQFAAVGGARPGMQAMAARNAMLGTAMAQSEVGNQSAQAAGQVTLGAQGAYGQHLSAARGQDIQQHQVNNNSQLQAWMQQQQLAGMQQMGGMGYEAERRARYAAMLGQNQPTDTEKYMGMLQGGLSAYAATRGGAGTGGGGGQIGSPVQSGPGSVSPYSPQPY